MDLESRPVSAGDVGTRPAAEAARQWTRRRFVGVVGSGTAGAVSVAGPFVGTAAAKRQREVVLVRDGRPQSLIVVEEPDSPFVVDAAHELRDHVAKASGVELELVDPHQPPSTGSKRAAVHIGRGRLADALARADGVDLEPEAFWIKTVGNKLLIVGHDVERNVAARASLIYAEKSPATAWGVRYLLDRCLGVRWLWPGHLGTYVPEQPTIAIPEIDVIELPNLIMRYLRIHLPLTHQRPGGPNPQLPEELRLLTEEEFELLEAEAYQWMMRHQMGGPSLRAGHSFTDWWEKYSETNPDYFAEPPPGVEQPWPQPERVKLRLGNPDVVDQVVQEWQDEGAPDFYTVTPNDGRGFCTHESTRALDIPPDQPIEEIWNGDAQLTARYVRFWNALVEQMRPINPNIILRTLAYSTFASPPPPEVELNDATVVGYSPGGTNYGEQERAIWQGWTDAGGRGLFLRPNWWHAGAGWPWLPLREMGNFFKFVIDNRASGTDFDSLIGYWGVQGPIYYLITRLHARPDLAVDDIIDEFCSAFGSAAVAIRDYIGYWETFTDATDFEALREELDLPTNSRAASHQALPHLFTDDVLAPAHSILDTAGAAATQDGEDVHARIGFLRGGLRHLEKVRDVVQLGLADRESQEFLDAAAELRTLRTELTMNHVVWGESLYLFEARRGDLIPTFSCLSDDCRL